MNNQHQWNKATDEQLLEEYRSSSSLHTLGVLYNRHLSFVYGVALKYLQNKADAEDMCMEIFESLPKKLKGKNITSFKPWIYRVTTNTCLDLLRKNKTASKHKKEIEIMQSEQSERYTIDDKLQLESNLVALEDCIETLQNEQKQCIDLFYLKKMSYADVSSQLGISWAKTRSLIQNGRRNLKNCMEEKNERRS